MSRKILSLVGIVLVLIFMSSCAGDPEKQLLDRYFQADSLSDVATLSTMAIAPVSIDAESYEILSRTEEVIEPATLPDLNKEYLDLKKQVEDSVGITLAASDELDNAKFEEETARTAGAKRAARAKVREAQAKYDEQYEEHKQLQTDKNAAEAAAAKEEEITLFSLGVQELVNVRELTGEVAFKELTVRAVTAEGTKDYKFYLRKYTLEDEATNQPWRGRWVITKIEPLD
ncbi:MAG: hypothetical protein PVF22_03340 [Candidatus Aminicenantes bacterium]